jgi:hypothetical protein
MLLLLPLLQRKNIIMRYLWLTRLSLAHMNYHGGVSNTKTNLELVLSKSGRGGEVQQLEKKRVSEEAHMIVNDHCDNDSFSDSIKKNKKKKQSKL